MLIPFDDPAILEQERSANALIQHAVEGICLLKEITQRLNSEGASQEIAIMIESIDTEALPERYPKESFTIHPTPTNLSIAAESAVQAVIKALGKASKAVIEFIVKLYKSIIDAISGLFNKLASVIRGQKKAKETEAKSNDLGSKLDGEAIKDYNPEDGSYALNDKVEFEDGDYKLTLHYDIIQEALSPLVVKVYDNNLTPGDLQHNIMGALQDAKSTNARYEEFVDAVNAFNESPEDKTLQTLVSWLRNEEEREHYHDIYRIAKVVGVNNLSEDLHNLMGHGLGTLLQTLKDEDEARYEGDAGQLAILKRMVRSRYDLEQLEAFSDFEKHVKKLDRGINGIKKNTFELVERGWDPELRSRVQQSVNVYLEYFRNRSRFNTQIISACAIIIQSLGRFATAQTTFEGKLYGELLRVKEQYEYIVT